MTNIDGFTCLVLILACSVLAGIAGYILGALSERMKK